MVERQVRNPWMIGHEGELETMNERVNASVQKRNECAHIWQGRERLQVRAGDDRLRLVQELKESRLKVKNARKAGKKYMRRIKKEWCSEKIREFKEASEAGRISKIFELLRGIGWKGVKIRIEEWKDNE